MSKMNLIQKKEVLTNNAVLLNIPVLDIEDMKTPEVDALLVKLDELANESVESVDETIDAEYPLTLEATDGTIVNLAWGTYTRNNTNGNYIFETEERGEVLVQATDPHVKLLADNGKLELGVTKLPFKLESIVFDAAYKGTAKIGTIIRSASPLLQKVMEYSQQLRTHNKMVESDIINATASSFKTNPEIRAALLAEHAKEQIPVRKAPKMSF